MHRFQVYLRWLFILSLLSVTLLVVGMILVPPRSDTEFLWVWTFASIQATVFALAAFLSAQMLNRSLYVRIFGVIAVISALGGWVKSLFFFLPDTDMWFAFDSSMFIFSLIGAHAGFLFHFAENKRTDLIRKVAHISGIFTGILMLMLSKSVNYYWLYSLNAVSVRVAIMTGIVALVSTSVVVLQTIKQKRT